MVRPREQLSGRSWFGGVRAKMMMAISSILLFGLIASVVAVIGYANVRTTMEAITGRAIPAMNAAQTLALQAERLVALAPVLAAVDKAADREQISQRIHDTKEAFSDKITRLAQNSQSAERMVSLQGVSTALLSNLDELDNATRRRIELADRRVALLQKINDADAAAGQVIAPLKTIATAGQQEATRALMEQAAPGEMRDAASRLAEGARLGAAVAGAAGEIATVRSHLIEAAGATNDDAITIAEAHVSMGLVHATAALTDLPAGAADVLRQTLTADSEAGSGPDGLLATRREELGILARAQELMDSNRALSERLADAVATMVRNQEADIATDAAATDLLLRRSRTMQILVSVAGILASLLIAFFYVGRVLVSRLIALGDAMGQISAGRLDTEIRWRGRDEISRMAQNLVIFRDTAREVESARSQREAERVQAAAERRRDMLGIADRFEENVKHVVDGVSATATEMHGTASHLSESAGATQRQARSAAEAAEVASQNVEGAATAASELSASITEIARRADEAATVAKQGAVDAQHADRTIRSLDETVGKIDSILDLIAGIAAQTNLLALNATIEAARAGDAGKGFAVVASEVKILAGRTAQATRQIGDQIAAIHVVSGEAVEAIHNSAATITTIEGIVAAIAAAVEEQDSATNEIARHVVEAADRTASASDNIGKVRGASEATGAAAGVVLGATERMNAEAERLLLQVDRFLVEVRANAGT